MDNYINSAVEHFRTLLTEQLERTDRMANDTYKTDFAALDEIVIGVCGGDGIGPIITAEAERLLRNLLADDVAIGKIRFETVARAPRSPAQFIAIGIVERKCINL